MSLRHAVLIVLADRDATGYDLTKCFDQAMGYFWHATHQQIYQELAKMAELDWIAYQAVEQTHKPSKKLYHITPAGRAELQRWLAEPTELAPLKDALLMKVYAGHLGDPAALLAEIERHVALQQAGLAQYREIERAYFQHLDRQPLQQSYVYLTLRAGILHTETWLEWAEEVKAFLLSKLAVFCCGALFSAASAPPFLAM